MRQISGRFRGRGTGDDTESSLLLTFILLGSQPVVCRQRWCARCTSSASTLRSTSLSLSVRRCLREGGGGLGGEAGARGKG